MVNSFHFCTSLIRILLFPALGTLSKCQFLKPKIQVARLQCAIAQMLKCENVCLIAGLHSLVISYFSKIIYQRYNKNKFFKTTWHRYFHNHHVLEQRTHDQNVVTTKLSGQTQDSNET